MERWKFDPVECLRESWQVLLIASLPGSLLHIWAVLNAAELHAAAQVDDAPGFIRLGAWSVEHGFISLLAVPLMAIALLLLHGFYRDRLPSLSLSVGSPAPAPAKPMRLDAMTTAARELLAAVSPRGEFRLVPQLAGAAVVASGTDRDDDRVFYDPVNREVTQRYRYALAELERAGLIERAGEARRLSAMGWPAARILTRQELDRIAQRTRHLSEPEQRLLRVIADCRQRFKVDKVMLRRDGSAASVIYGNGQTVPVPDLRPAEAVLIDATADDAAAQFERLVGGIPEDYLVALPERRPGAPFVLRLTETGLRYLRFADVAQAAAA